MFLADHCEHCLLGGVIAFSSSSLCFGSRRTIASTLLTGCSNCFFIAGPGSLVTPRAQAAGATSEQQADAPLHPYLKAVVARDPMFLSLLPLVTADIARLAAANSAVGEALLPRLCALVRTLDGVNSDAVTALLSAEGPSDVPAAEEGKVRASLCNSVPLFLQGDFPRPLPSLRFLISLPIRNLQS